MTRSSKKTQRVLLDNLSLAAEALRKSKEQAASPKVQAVKNAGKYLPPVIHTYKNKQGRLISVIAFFRADQPTNPYMALKCSARTALQIIAHASAVQPLASVIVADQKTGDTDE